MDTTKAPAPPLVSVRGLRRTWVRRSWLPPRALTVTALDGVDLDIAPGSTMGLIGRSGSGKSTLARCISGLDRPTEGRILFEGRAVAATCRRVQLIPQDPGASLNARYSVLDTLSEPLAVRGVGRAMSRARSRECLAMVGLSDCAAAQSPALMSGGQRARLALARALAALDLESGPALLILDESLSNLDLSTQAQIMNLLLELQQRHNLALLLIAHDLSVVRHMADTVLEMSDGRVVAEC
jgi:oligopeptide transport system ATP-binding protein